MCGPTGFEEMLMLILLLFEVERLNEFGRGTKGVSSTGSNVLNNGGSSMTISIFPLLYSICGIIELLSI